MVPACVEPAAAAATPAVRPAPPAAAQPADDGDAEPARAARPPVALQWLAALAVIAALWAGARFLIPVTAGVLLAMLAEPAVARVQRWLPSRTAAAALVVVASVLAGGWLPNMFSTQLLRMTERLPDVVRLAASELGSAPGAIDGTWRRARDALRELEQALGLRSAGPVPRAHVAAPPAPPEPSLSANATAVLAETAVVGSGKLIALATELAIAVFVAFFVLAGAPALARRFVELWPTPAGRRRAAAGLRETARQARLYAGVLTVVNVLIGVGVWLWFKAFSIPDPLTWAVAAALLHVVPYLGIAVFAVLAAAETYLTYGEVAAALTTAGVVVALSTLVGTVVTAWLQGHAARMNPAAVFIGTVFWGTLWGLWGLLLGPALVVAVKVAADHHPPSRRWARLLA